MGTLATAIGLSPSRVHQLMADADLDALDAASSELRQQAGQPGTSRLRGGNRTRRGRDTIAGRLSDEVSWLRQCDGPGSRTWTLQLPASGRPAPVRRLARPGHRGGRPRSESRPRSSTGSPPTWTNSPGPGPDHRRGAARPARLNAAGGWPASSTPHLERLGRLAGRGNTSAARFSQPPGYSGNPFRPRWRHPPCDRAIRAVQETGTRGDADGSIVTGTPGLTHSVTTVSMLRIWPVW